MTTTPTERRATRVLVLTGMVLLAVNLRPAVTSLGVALESVRSDLDMSTSVAGVLTTLPVLCFAIVGSLAGALARWMGIHRAVLVSLVAMVGGLTLRGFADSTAAFLVGSVVALGGMATGNVLLPPLVKLHFPTRIGAVTGIYSTALLVGASLPSFVGVPVSSAAGTWRAGLLMWAVTAAVALVPWLGLLRHDVHTSDESTTIPLARLARTRLAWAMGIFFGIQSAMAYSQFGWLTEIYADGGMSDAQAALMLGIVTGVAIPVPLLLPALINRFSDQRLVVVAFGVLSASGFIGLEAAPTTLPWLWALLMGLGSSAFPWVLTMLGLRARTPDGTVALSGFVQSTGYLLAAFGPLGAGVLFDLTGAWTLPLLVLAGANVVLVLAGLYVATPRFIEDELAPPSLA